MLHPIRVGGPHATLRPALQAPPRPGRAPVVERCQSCPSPDGLAEMGWIRDREAPERYLLRPKALQGTECVAAWSLSAGLGLADEAWGDGLTADEDAGGNAVVEDAAGAVAGSVAVAEELPGGGVDEPVFRGDATGG